MKKSTAIIIAIFFVLIVLGVILFIIGKNQNELTDKNEIAKIVAQSHLELLLNFEDVENKNFEEQKLLEISMALARKLGLMSEKEDGTEYVSPEEIHQIISELTDIIVEAPIQTEDFYYIYDSENECYAFLSPALPPYYDIFSIDHAYHESDNIYVIECTATKSQDGELIANKKIITTLKYNEDNNLINYQIIKQKVS